MGLFGKSKKERETEYMSRLDVPSCLKEDFELIIDDIFTIMGVGTVATGNILTGMCREGENACIYEETYENVPEFCYSASFDEVKEKGFTLVPSRYIEFVNRDENIDFDTKMKSLQGELKELLVQEEKSKSDLLAVFKELGYEIEL